MVRLLILAVLGAASLLAQMPRGIFPWWNRPEIARNLNLTPGQRQEIRGLVQQYRPHLINVRMEVNQAEQALVQEFNRNPVDPAKANIAIERLVDARSDLTRTLSQLSLKLRLVLTDNQWQQLERERANQKNQPAPAEPDEQK